MKTVHKKKTDNIISEFLNIINNDLLLHNISLIIEYLSVLLNFPDELLLYCNVVIYSVKIILLWYFNHYYYK